MPTVCGRLERVVCDKQKIEIFIDYAHTPDALEKLLCTASELKGKGGRILLLFGCGGDRDKSKRAAMGRIASRDADYTVVTSDNSRGEDPNEIISQIVAGIGKDCQYTVIPDRERAIRQAVTEARAGDWILLSGKGHEEYEITRDGKRAFSEIEIVRAAFEERIKKEEKDTEEGI